MGLATDGELNAAVTGQKPFKSSISNTRVLFRVYTPASRFPAELLCGDKVLRR